MAKKYGFIVEGFNDELKMLQISKNSVYVVTKGTRMNNKIKMDIQKAMDNCDELLVLLDPDEAGEILFEMIHSIFPTLRRVILEREKCLCQRGRKLKVGVEHASIEYLESKLKENGVFFS